jgi:alginate export protein
VRVRATRALALLALCALALDARAQGAGRIHFRGRTAAIGAGFAWGASTLEFDGKTYPVRVDGFVLGALGTASIDADGEVTGLTKAEDLNGDFTAVSSGLTVGSGASSLLMRNDKGVRITMTSNNSGFQLGLGPRGVTLSVGPAGGPPADASARLPQTLGFGEMTWGPLALNPTLNAQVYIAGAHNAGFGGNWSFGPVDKADFWFEHSNEVGLNARLSPGEDEPYGTLQARVSGVFSMTTSGPDGPVCNTKNTTDDYTLEAAYLDWRSGNLFPSLGHNAIELSGGNQNYQVFDGLLFWDGGQDCSGRGANWLSPRKAFQGTGIFRLTLKQLTLEAVHLKYNDHPSSGTALWGERMEWVTDDTPLAHLKLGLMYFHVYDSRIPTRDGMNGIYAYHESTPLRALPGLTFKATFVRESNDQSSGLTAAYGWYVAPSYQFLDTKWTPQIGYRYASFSGGGTHAFDSLFTGLPDWGYWFQGEMLGEYVLSNSNLNSHQARLTVKPSDWLTTNLVYYHFLLDDKNQSFGLTPTKVSSHSLADEVDLIFDVTMTNWWSITATVAMANPNKGFTQAVGDSSTWISGYLYMNFNF